MCASKHVVSRALTTVVVQVKRVQVKLWYKSSLSHALCSRANPPCLPGMSSARTHRPGATGNCQRVNMPAVKTSIAQHD